MTEHDSPLPSATPAGTEREVEAKAITGLDETPENALDRRTGEDRRGDVDRRIHPRYFLTADAEVVEPRTRTRFTGRATDISVGGCYLDTLSPLPVGTAIYIRLTRGDETFQSKASITYFLTGMGLGLSFMETLADQSAILSRWIAHLSGQPIADTQLASQDMFAPVKQEAAANASGWREVIGELVKLLATKQVLTEAEATAIRRKISE